MSRSINKNLNNKQVDKSIYFTFSDLKKATKKRSNNEIKLSWLSRVVMNLQLSSHFVPFQLF